MITTLRGWWHSFTGAGDHAVTVPPMDGPLHPNTRLEQADRLLAVDQPNNLCVADGRLLFTSGNRVLYLDADAKSASEIAVHAAPITAMAAGGGAMAVALADGTIDWRRPDGSSVSFKLPPQAGAPCVVAMLVEKDRITVANGSARNVAADWKRDLMEKGSSGSVWQFVSGGEPRLLADRMAFPYGLARLADGQLACSESWRHRIVRLVDHGPVRPLLADLPAYPARLTPAADGGWWLAAFAPRTQMVEFMLREDRARRQMIDTINPDYWMAPRYATGRSFREPLQGGGIKHLGILKPWAPSQSYGLVIRLDEQMQPLASHHSRADGTVHGITSCLEAGNRLYAASKGANCLVALDAAEGAEASR